MTEEEKDKLLEENDDLKYKVKDLEEEKETLEKRIEDLEYNLSELSEAFDLLFRGGLTKEDFEVVEKAHGKYCIE